MEKDLFSQENDIIVPENFNEADEQLAKIAEMSKRPYLLLKENNFFEGHLISLGRILGATKSTWSL